MLTNGKRVGVRSLEGHRKAGLRLREDLQVQVRHRTCFDGIHQQTITSRSPAAVPAFTTCKKRAPTCCAVPRRADAAPQQRVDGALVPEQLQQRRHVGRVGEGDAVHRRRPLGRRLPPRRREEDVAVQRATGKRLRREAIDSPFWKGWNYLARRERRYIYCWDSSQVRQ